MNVKTNKKIAKRIFKTPSNKLSIFCTSGKTEHFENNIEKSKGKIKTNVKLKNLGRPGDQVMNFALKKFK